MSHRVEGRSSSMHGWWWILSVFLISGLAGLLYEVIWSRLLILIFGNTTHAVSAVLAAYMFGMAIGSHVAGRISSSMEQPIRVYAILEAGIGLYALVFPFVLGFVQEVHIQVFPALHQSGLWFTLARLGMAMGLLILPTTLMGATLPILVRACAGGAHKTGIASGTLYAVNTLGASLGCFLGAFLFIPTIGFQRSLWLGALLNGIVAVLAWMLGRKRGAAAHDPAEPKTRTLSDAAASPGQGWIALGAFGVSGLLALLYEVAWTRALILVFGSSVYAFSTMLTTYLFGMAAGSLALAKFADRTSRPITIMVGLEAILGISVLLSTPLIGKLPNLFMQVFAHPGVTWSRVALIEFAVCGIIMIVPTFCSGACFPFVARILSSATGEAPGRAAGDAYSLNTLGGILGSLAAGFVLIPLMGVERTLLTGGGGSLLVAAILLLLTQYSRRVVALGAGGLVSAALASVVVLPSWNPKVMSSGVYLYAKFYDAEEKKALGEIFAPTRLLYYREGPSATVAVFEDKDRYLRVNGKTDASASGDQYTQVLLGVIPLMYAKHPEEALVIGLGSGITLGSVLASQEVRHADCIEISPEVVEASRFFQDENGHALQDPRTTLHVMDARTWLMANERAYDLITSEPSHPWQTGNANLFTLDFYEIGKKRIRKGGIFCQWLPYYRMEKAHFEILLRTFYQAFKHVNVWVMQTDAILIGSLQPLDLDASVILRRFEDKGIQQRLKGLGIHNMMDFMSFLWLDEGTVEAWVKDGRGLNTDDFPVIEFHAPQYTLELTQPETLLALVDRAKYSKLPVQGIQRRTELEVEALYVRANYLKSWGIPEWVIKRVLSPF